MEEIYFAENNSIIKEIYNFNSNEEYIETDEWVEKSQEYLNDKFINMTTKKKLVETEDYDRLDLELDITSKIPINLQNVIDFLQIGEHVFSLELLVQWFDLFINEISISSDISICLKKIEIGYLMNKKIVHEDKILPKRNELLEQLYLEYEQELKSKPVTQVSQVKNNSSNYILNPFLQYKVNKLKNKIKNKKINKNISFKLKGKEYNFHADIKISKDNNNLVETKYPKSKYFEKYNSRITDEIITKQKQIIETNEFKNSTFWNNYNKSKNDGKNKIESVFSDEHAIDFDKESFYQKYNGKHYSVIYKDIIHELNELENQYKKFKIIESYYNKLKENQNISFVFKNQNNKINCLFTDYENNRINEYKLLSEIGELILNDKLTKEEKSEINSMNQNTRPYRILKQSQRIYKLEEHVNIKNIALAGISNWLRDTSDDNFNILLDYFNACNDNNNINESDDEIHMEYDPPKLNFNIDMHDMPFDSDDD